jgi:TRAP-type uncharacterized transport system substrate-binding protein
MGDLLEEASTKRGQSGQVLWQRSLSLGYSPRQIIKGLAAAVVVVSVVSLALIYFFPTPPSKVVIATGVKGSSFEFYGKRYREIFARYNIDLELRPTAGALDNLIELRNPDSGVQIAFVTGGLSNGKNAPGLLSLGTIYAQPFWIFYSSTASLEQLSQLKNKRIAVGPPGSGTRYAALRILGKAGVNSETANMLTYGGSAAVKALNDGFVDIVWMVGAPDVTAIQSLLRNPKVRLMSFPMAEAYTRNFPELVRLTLPQGVVDIEKNIPPADLQLIGTTTKVLVRSDLHPEIVQLLLQAMVEVHGKADIFQRSGEYPQATDVEFPVADAAIDYYKNGPSFMQRHLPLWLSVHAQRAIAALVAAIAIGFPLFHFLPQIYNWLTRRRLIYWYGQLKALEASFDASRNVENLTEKQAAVERIEEAVSHIRIPLTFSDQLYNLRSHIDIVRRKITSRANAPKDVAAE